MSGQLSGNQVVHKILDEKKKFCGQTTNELESSCKAVKLENEPEVLKELVTIKSQIKEKLKWPFKKIS